jgi:iron complex transport system substrate-binding protein
VLAGTLNEKGQIIEQLSNSGIPVLVLAPENMGMIYNDVLLVGKALNAHQNATNVVKDMHIVVNYVSAKVNASQRPSVFYEVWNNPLMTAGPTSFIGQLITLAGANNIFLNVTEQYPTVNPEAVVTLDPEIIIATNEFNMTAEQVANQPGFQTTAAVKAKAVYVLSNPDLIEQPSPRLVEGLLVLAKLIHPNLFNSTTIAIFSDFSGEFNDTSLSQFSSS